MWNYSKDVMLCCQGGDSMQIIKAFQSKYRGELKPVSCLQYEAAGKRQLLDNLNKTLMEV